MGKKKEIEDWFLNSAEQQRWALGYLEKHGMHIHQLNSHAEWIAHLRRMSHSLHPGERKCVADLRKAWEQRVNEKRSGRKTYSFSMSTSIRPKLEKLAGGRTKSGTLQLLIERGFDFENEERARRKAALDEELEVRRKRQSLLNRTSQGELRAGHQVKTLKTELAAWSVELEALLFENCRYREQLLALGELDHKLGPDQQAAVSRAYDERLAYLQRLIQQKVRENLPPGSGLTPPESTAPKPD